MAVEDMSDERVEMVPEIIRVNAQPLTIVDWEKYEKFLKKQPFVDLMQVSTMIPEDAKKDLATLAQQEAIDIFMWSPDFIRRMQASSSGIAMFILHSVEKKGITKEQVGNVVTMQNGKAIMEFLYELNDLPWAPSKLAKKDEEDADKGKENPTLTPTDTD